MKSLCKIILAAISVILTFPHISLAKENSTKTTFNNIHESCKGSIDTLRYDISVNGKMIEKEALVYLPYCYDDSDNHTRYNVLYLVHGGGDNTGSFFSIERTPNTLNNIADELIQDGKMGPMLIVSVTYYPPEEICMSKGMDSTINYIRHFHREMREYIIPAVGRKYNTHLQSFDDASISATRQNRAYGGFSMGALSTWYQLAFDPQSFGQYVPMSGDLWIYDGEGNKESSDTAAKWLNDRIASSPYRDGDINIFAYSGTNDIAFGPESALIESMKKHCPLLVYSDNPESGNLHFLTEKDGVHNYEWISKYLKDVMPRLWKNTVKNSNDTD